MASSETSQALAKDVDRMLADTRKNLEASIEGRVEKLESQFRSRFLGSVGVLILIAAGATIGGMYAQSRSVNEAVIQLQKDVIAAQTVIRESADDLDRARQQLSEMTAQLSETRQRYEQRLATLEAAQP